MPKRPIPELVVLTISAAAARFPLSGAQIRSLMSSGAIAGRKIDGRWFVDEASLTAYVAAPTRKAGRGSRAG